MQLKLDVVTSWFQEGEDLDDLLAEINEELPSEEEDDDIDPTLTNVQRRVNKTFLSRKNYSIDSKQKLNTFFNFKRPCGRLFRSRVLQFEAIKKMTFLKNFIYF